MGTTILVTGSAGFVGSHVTKELLKRDYRVIGIDCLTDYYSVELKTLRMTNFDTHGNFSFANIDLSNADETEKVFQENEIEGVIHLAAQAGVRLPLEVTGKYIDSNITGFFNILKNSIKYEIPNFVYASSSSVYGDLSPLPYSESSKLLSPKSFYGATKLNNEQTAPILTSGTRTSTRGLRFFTVYGPWGRPDMAYFRLMAAALEKHNFQIFGDGTIERDFTYIDDVVSSTIQLFENLSKSETKVDDIVNIGGQRPLSMNYLIHQVQQISGRKLDISIKQSNPSDSQKTVADNSYLKLLIGETSFTPLEVGLENFYSWMKSPGVFEHVENWVKSSI